MYFEPYKTCKRLKQMRHYVNLPQKNIAELKPCNSLHIDRIVMCTKSIRQNHPGGCIIMKEIIIT